ncbi:translocase of the inner membrane [Paraphaeosphaeria minitans]
MQPTFLGNSSSELSTSRCQCHITMDHSRDPCPWVALNDFGGAFCMGAVGGAIWHGVKGFRNSPYGERRIGAVTAIKARAPVLGGNFGVWGGLFSTFDCAVKGIRKKEDPWNGILGGFCTGAALAVRGGAKAMRNNAIACGVLIGVIEGVGIMFGRMMAENTRLEAPPPPPQQRQTAIV